MDLATRHIDVKPPRDAGVWSMINGGGGATEQHNSCTHGRHDFEWCPEILEIECLFCLKIQELSGEDDDPYAAPSQLCLRRKIVRKERENMK